MTAGDQEAAQQVVSVDPRQRMGDCQGMAVNARMKVHAVLAEEQRVQEVVRRHVRTRAFAEAEDVISFVLSDPGVQEARAQVEAAEAEFGMELCARLQPFQDRYDQAVRDGDAARLTGICPGKHGRWGRICVLDDGHETLMEEPHWGRNSEGRPIAWVGRAPHDW